MAEVHRAGGVTRRMFRFILEKEWMGGAIYGNVFASRSHFLDYTLDFETRLAVAQAIKPGHGILIFCGTGFAWHKSNLEDFADFYMTGTHRGDDPFALMEQHHVKEEEIKLRATSAISRFCAVVSKSRRRRNSIFRSAARACSFPRLSRWSWLHPDCDSQLRSDTESCRIETHRMLLKSQALDLVIDVIDMDQNGAFQPRNGRLKFGETNSFHRAAI